MYADYKALWREGLKKSRRGPKGPKFGKIFGKYSVKNAFERVLAIFKI